MPVFVLDPRLLGGRFPSANRAWFLHGCLAELREALRERGADLVIREGRPEEELPALARECGAEAVYFAADVSPFARARDRRVAEVLDARPQPGLFIADDLGAVKPYSVFTPFWRAWQQLPRREIHGAPRALHFPSGLSVGRLPATPEPEAREPFPPGERAARERANRWFADGLGRYEERHDRLAGGTSAALALPALRLRLAARARGARARARRRRATPASSPGATSTPRCCSLPARNTRRAPAALPRLEWDDDADELDGLARGPHRLPGRRRRRCASSSPRAGCTTARA